MTITAEESNAFKEAEYASSEDSDNTVSHRVGTNDKDSPKASCRLQEKGDSGFNSSDDNVSSVSESNSVCSTDTPKESKNKVSSRDSGINISPLSTKPSDSPLDFLRLIKEGTKVDLPDDFKVPIDKPPEWFDLKKYQLGQQFGQKYYFGINFAEMISLYLLFLPRRALEPLVFTGNSHTPYKAFKRYLSTSLRVKTWIDCDIWNPDSAGYKNLRTVRALHLNVKRKLKTCPASEIKQKGTMAGEPGKEGVWCPMYEGIKKDVQASCPFASTQVYQHVIDEMIESDSSNHMYFCQTDMSITQFGFVGLILLYPDKFGAGSATEEELEGFAHLWRSIGYLLGIEDDFNFCKGTLSEVRQRSSHTLDLLIKPRLHEVSADWEHMSRCMVEGISYYVTGVSFEVSFCYLCWVLDIQVPSVTSSLNFYQNCMFFLIKLFMCHTSKIPSVLKFHNHLLNKTLEKVQKKPKEWHDKLEKKRYDFQKDMNKDKKDKYLQVNDELPVVF